MELQIVPMTGYSTIPIGDFGARLDGRKLLVPQRIHDALQRRRLITAEQLLAFTQTDPGPLAADLGWSEQDMLRACETLFATLRGHVDDEVLTRPTRRRSFGALPPKR